MYGVYTLINIQYVHVLNLKYGLDFNGEGLVAIAEVRVFST